MPHPFTNRPSNRPRSVSVANCDDIAFRDTGSITGLEKTDLPPPARRTWMSPATMAETTTLPMICPGWRSLRPLRVAMAVPLPTRAAGTVGALATPMNHVLHPHVEVQPPDERTETLIRVLQQVLARTFSV